MVSRIERAKTGTSLEKIEAIAEALGIPPASLFGGEPPPKSDGPRGQALQKLESIIAQATDDQVRLIQRLAAAVRERREE
jgi:transcriptional regulator with XRE-family HTH domain